MSWALDVLNGAPTDAEILGAHFDPTFLEAVPADQLAAQLTALAQSGPYRLENVQSGSTPTVVSAVIVRDTQASAGSGEGTGGLASLAPMQVTLVTGPLEPHLITHLVVHPAPYWDPTLPVGWPAIQDALRQLAPTVSLLAADVTDGTCRPINALNADQELPIGSAFKLYVLGALVQGVADGRNRWDEVLPIDPSWRSPSSAALRTLPDGQSLTLRDYAGPMIAVSDNTAADHLIHHLGREHVEAMLTTMGHSHPELDIPFPTTRELFALKVALSYDQRQGYLNGDVAARRGLLDQADAVDDATLLWGASLWTAPRFADSLEWFASGEDLCRAMVSLRGMADTAAGAPVLDILSANPGMAFDPSRWTYIGYKGGSEPGVLNFTWLLRRDDERWFVLTLTFLDTNHTIDLDPTLRLAAAAANELGRE